MDARFLNLTVGSVNLIDIKWGTTFGGNEGVGMGHIRRVEPSIQWPSRKIVIMKKIVLSLKK